MRSSGMVLGLTLGLLTGSTMAADLIARGPDPAFDAPRYFPRGDGADASPRRPAPAPRQAGCRPRRAPVPTNAPDDPSYVGSTYGLAKPSYYGLTPPLGVDDPFGRPLLGDCR
ncbi:hypothetical protein [uncultured Methylobacterium sp.]|uniref:hypothetical protein n=1 Tax=uncultured Methylobacterium sp. TaxID=157278 RepID=UPI0035CC7272